MNEPVWSLRDEVARLENDALLVNISVEGQLMHRRRISRKCSFFDLASVATNLDNQRERLEVILKIIDGELSLEEVDAIRHRFKVGDIVRVRGFVERLEGSVSILIHARDNERLHLKRVRAHIAEDPLDPHGKIGKQQRAQVFAEWLVETFGADFLANGKGVVDVAGGRGSLSFELWNKRKLPCTLVEPRPMKLSKQQHKFLKKQKKVRKQSGETESFITESPVPQVTALFNMDTFLKKTEHVQLVEQASLLLGVHPDEATESIFDVAIKFNKPFAVVPCCVFGQKFPSRRLADGSKVLSYENLVEYLISKHPDIEKAFLPFDGKNLVLFRRPSLARTGL